MTEATLRPEDREELEALVREKAAAASEFLQERPLIAAAIGVGIGILIARVLGD